MPKVTIVLPTYNGQEYISESIDSIINQSFTDWELIIVNDCSTDGTQNIIDDYLKKDSRIREIKNETNMKLPMSLNIGFRDSHGEYLTWSSDDNVYMDKALEEMVFYLDDNEDTYMVCADMKFINKTGEEIGTKLEYDGKNMIIGNCVGACFLYRRCVLHDIGEYDSKRFLVEDYDYWLRILFHYGKIGHIPYVMYKYRQHEASLTGTRKKEIYEQKKKLINDNIEYIIKWLKEDKKLLYLAYYNLKSEDILNERSSHFFSSEINGLVDIENSDDKIIIYGAGNVGRTAYQQYNERTAYYADINHEIVGKKINDVEIISISKMVELKNRYVIMIASQPSNLGSFIEVLEKNNVDRFAIFCPKSI